MRVEVLISTMHQKSHDFLSKMNISTEAVVINQTDFENYEEFVFLENLVKIFCTSERGIAKSRNKALSNSSADIAVLADDDMQFSDDYENIVRSTFKKYDADIIIFNFIDDDNESNRKNFTAKKINVFNYMNYGAARIAFKNDAVKNKNISFKETYNDIPLPTCGEDTLFLREALKKGLRIIAVPEAIAKLENDRNSTWFKGYTKEYFFDKGVVLGIAHPILAIPFALFLVLRHKEYSKSGFNRFKVFNEIFKGIKSIYKN